jgi:hypothetical protein
MKRIAILSLLATLLFSLSSVQAYGTGSIKNHSQSYGNLSANWWQWLRSIPKIKNPLLMSGAIDCLYAQTGPVIFLAGTTGQNSGDDPIVRKCTVPNGKPLFFSMMNAMYLNEVGEQTSQADKRNILESLLSDRDDNIDIFGGVHACQLGLSVDGKSVLQSGIPIIRNQSPAFRMTINENDVFDGIAGTFDKEAVSDGFWVLLRLPKGQHSLHAEGDLCDLSNQPLSGTHQNYIYQLTVK